MATPDDITASASSFTLQAVILSDEADWEAIADWCGGTLSAGLPSTAEITILEISRPGQDPIEAYKGEMVVLLPTGEFVIYAQKPDADWLLEQPFCPECGSLPADSQQVTR